MKVCPKCGSKNIEYSEDKFFKLGRDTQQFLCNDCGYIGPVIVDKEE